MPRITEVDEPLAVDPLSHLLQELDPAAVVLDQIVVRREDGGDLALGAHWRERDLYVVDAARSCVSHSSAGCSCAELCPNPVPHKQEVRVRPIQSTIVYVNDLAETLVVQK